MENEQLQKRVEELEMKIQKLERLIEITPTQTILHGSVVTRGLLYADRTFTKRSGNYVELTT